MGENKIKYYKHQDIDYRKWDSCITNSFNGIVYAYSWYLDIVSPGWEALIKGDYEIVMPLTYGYKYRQHYLFQPLITQQLGVFSTKKLDAGITAQFLNSIPEKFSYVDINLNIFNKLDEEQLISRRNITYELDLIRTYDKILREYSTNTKRNVKKALEQRVFVSRGNNTESLISLFRNDKGKELKKVTDADYDKIRKLINFSLSHKLGQIYFAYNEKQEIIAGAFFITSHQKSIYLFSASNEEGKEKSAMFAIIDGFIKINSERNITLDFEGSNIEGLARFYSSFGAKACEYLSVKINRLPFIYKLFKK